MATSYAVNIRLKSSIRFFLGTTFMVVVIFIFYLKLNKKNSPPSRVGKKKKKKKNVLRRWPPSKQPQMIVLWWWSPSKQSEILVPWRWSPSKQTWTEAKLFNWGGKSHPAHSTWTQNDFGDEIKGEEKKSKWPYIQLGRGKSENL